MGKSGDCEMVVGETGSPRDRYSTDTLRPGTRRSEGEKPGFSVDGRKLGASLVF